jgi:microsomal dipeptidase-like Zn-dependent dipeptidase
MERVWEAFKKAGITERQIDKIQSQNALRVMQEVLG